MKFRKETDAHLTFAGWKDAWKEVYRKLKEERRDNWGRDGWRKNHIHRRRASGKRSTKAASHPHTRRRRPCDDSINENATSPSSAIPECHHISGASAVGQVWVLTKKKKSITTFHVTRDAFWILIISWVSLNRTRRKALEQQDPKYPHVRIVKKMYLIFY